jgi:hypothetical protein
VSIARPIRTVPGRSQACNSPPRKPCRSPHSANKTQWVNTARCQFPLSVRLGPTPPTTQFSALHITPTTSHPPSTWEHPGPSRTRTASTKSTATTAGQRYVQPYQRSHGCARIISLALSFCGARTARLYSDSRSNSPTLPRLFLLPLFPFFLFFLPLHPLYALRLIETSVVWSVCGLQTLSGWWPSCSLSLLSPSPLFSSRTQNLPLNSTHLLARPIPPSKPPSSSPTHRPPAYIPDPRQQRVVRILEIPSCAHARPLHPPSTLCTSRPSPAASSTRHHTPLHLFLRHSSLLLTFY